MFYIASDKTITLHLNLKLKRSHAWFSSDVIGFAGQTGTSSWGIQVKMHIINEYENISASNNNNNNTLFI